MRIKIVNGLVLDPADFSPHIADILIEDGRLVSQMNGDAAQTIDAAGLAVMPGLIDAHCHLREPGYEYKEDIVSGTKSARARLYNHRLHAEHQAGLRHAALVRFIREKSRQDGWPGSYHRCRIQGAAGQELAEIGLMAQEGIVPYPMTGIRWRART